MVKDDSDNNNFPKSLTSEKLNFKTKLAYGAGDLGPAITGNIAVFYLMVFFTNVAGIPAGLAGSILMIGKIWDGINDPVVGMLTDKTQSRRWGRRLPWLLYGAIPFGFFSFLQWIVPQFSADKNINIWGLFWYYVIIGIISQAFFTVVNLPYTAMTPELTQDYDERTSLNSFRFTFSIGGSILSLILAKIIFSQIADRQQQYLVLAAVCTVIAVLSLYWCVYGVRDRILAFEAKRISLPQEAEIPFFEQLKIVFSNKPFLFVISIYLFSWLGVQITASIIPYFVVNCMRLQEGDVPNVMIAVQGTALVMLFVWSYLSKRIGKKLVYFLGMSSWIIAAAGLFFLQPNQVGLMYVMAVMAGVGVSTAYLIPWSMIPDVIELDELQTGQRREGIFYGFMVLLQKFGLAFGLFLVGNTLQAYGFKEAVIGQTSLPIQPESALLAIRIAVGPIPTVCLIAGLVLIYFYPITREMHAEIMLKLQAQREKVG
ncbi:MFS transporter [Dolichospermum sp. ST_sed1]|nr:MFS transporter [Dolichospermum sp. ST_sed1]MDD1423989.1 MFS transporter [Dolichospermum sp. ST_sed9]MDD1430513.1 MFS transporter [Dolichospermum sp. ST_sed6]MDD1438041.1 MFS transporter [Dolichospermum sp. ST_sed10]MDD1439914.1 MFS transporter [Dolichospermum sp. ST_sed3]MDD1445703.1 MFS transporter [Dolichospermum sp. ST_sed8]MDD1454092.1 MFS transporter [Dolichospermum sp. ST_sed7]MDD1460305.1 MFS transporter [Dolichospermum sp. ST_sed2]MDD1465013.1 MFS transporter [Dolichospermum sp.